MDFINIDAAQRQIYWETLDGLHGVHLDGGVPYDLFDIAYGPRFEVDAAHGKVYLAGGSKPFPCLGGISRRDLDGTNNVTIFSGFDPGDIQLDALHGKLYWVVMCTLGPDSPSEIKRSNVDGTAVETLANHGANSLALDLQNEKIYWALDGIVERAELDGTGVETVLSGLSAPGRLAVAPIQEKVFVVVSDSYNSRRILSANLDGTNLTEVVPGGHRIADVAIDPLGPQIPAAGRFGLGVLSFLLVLASAALAVRKARAT